MKPKYFQSDSSHRDRWMVSYLDAITILLIFFVAAAAKTAPTIKKDPPPPAPVVVIDARKTAPVTPAPETLEQDKLEQDLLNAGLDVHRESRGLVIRLPQAIFFSSGDDRIGSAALPTVEKIAEVLRATSNHIVLTGHADSVPIHNRHFKNNWELSAARGMRLLELLKDRYGIDEARMSVSSDGSNRPSNSNETPDGRANNRRVEILILDEPAKDRAGDGRTPAALITENRPN